MVDFLSENIGAVERPAGLHVQRRGCALRHSNPHDRRPREDEAKIVSDIFFTLRKMPLDRIVDLSRADFISCDTDPDRQTGSGIRDGFQIDPHVLPVGKF